MNPESELTGSFLITLGLLLLAVLGTIWVDRVLIGMVVVCAVMLALVGREIRAL